MKKFIAVLLVFCFSMSFISCTTVKIQTKSGFAYLAPENGGKPPAKTVRNKMVFYALFGLIPITDNTTGDLIRAKEVVRVRTYMSGIDYLLTMLLGIATITTHTVEVEVIK
ncbi:MAG: hypothetical protein JXA66_03350 [Oligoflexia bacterium]|nr:hypothetical protein [Oligoflexia bacterium]